MTATVRVDAMAKTKTPITFDTRFRKGEKVTATVDLPGVPEGTTGKVKLINGLTWTRYWVFFDNGVDLGSIGQASLVRSKQWDAYLAAKADAEANAAAKAAAEAAEKAKKAAEAAAAPPAANPRIPAHLLERAKNRKKAEG